MKQTRVILGGKKGLPPSRITYPSVEPLAVERKLPASIRVPSTKPRPLMKPVKKSASQSLIQKALSRKKVAW